MQNLTLCGCTAALLAGSLAAHGAADQDGQDAAARGLQEIVVTARKREERLQETPISITAMSGEALATRQIETTQELARVVPNLIVFQGQSVSGIGPVPVLI